MSPEVVVGLDAGTTSTKFVAVDSSGSIVAESSSGDISVSVSDSGGAEQDSAEIWEAVVAACRSGVAQLEAATTVVGLALASQSGSVVPMTTHGPASVVTWMDRRSESLVDGWDAETKAMVRRESGWTLEPGLGLATIAWFGVGHPQAAFSRWAAVDDWLMWRFTGSWLTNPSNAAGTQLTEVESGRWSPTLCDLAGVEPDVLSQIVDSGTIAGALGTEVAGDLLMAGGTPVVVGGHDQTCGALALGAVEPGAVILSLGTAWVITAVCGPTRVVDVPAGFNLSPHVIDRIWTTSRNLGGLGAVIASALPAPGSPQRAGPGDVAVRALGDGFFIPDLARTGGEWGTFHGEVGDESARFAAVIEACAFEVRIAIEEAGDIGRGTGLTVVGGGTRSPGVTQSLADVLGRRVIIRPDASWPAIGAARLAALASGWDVDPGASLPALEVEPRPDQTAILDDRFEQYLKMRTEEFS
ncbi:MAG: xylulokinase [Acidimicrobiales bacterium]